MTPADHLPAVALRFDDTWGVFCLACSIEAKDYVYPCTLGPVEGISDRARGWPPAVLVDAP